MAEKKKNKFGTTVKDWFKGVKSEFKKIIWPTYDKIAKDTVVVLVSVIVIAAFLSALNWVFHFGLEKLIG